MSTRFRIPSRPILPQQLADILDRLDEIEGIRGGGIGGIGIGGAGGGIPGSGTLNAIPKWITTGSLGDSRFLDDGVATDLSYGDNKYSRLFVTAYGYSAGIGYVPEVICRYARGTQTALLPVLSQDTLGVFAARAYDGGPGFPISDNAKILMYAAANWSVTSRPTGIFFYTTPLGSIQEQPRVVINNLGLLGLYSPYYGIGGDTGLIMFATPPSGGGIYTLPSVPPPVSGYMLSCTTGGAMSWIPPTGGGMIAHSLLGATWHNDVDENTPATVGSLICSNSTPKWTKFENSGVAWQLLITTATGKRLGWFSQGPSGSILITGGGSPPVLSWVYPSTEGYVLTMSGGYPAWRPVAGGGMVSHPLLGSTWHSDVVNNAPSAGATIYGTASQWVKLVAGPDAYVLTMYGGYPTWRPAPGGGVGGSGTTNYLSKWTAPTTLGNSLMYESGGNVLVNSHFLPASDNARNLGDLSHRWASLAVGTGQSQFDGATAFTVGAKVTQNFDLANRSDDAATPPSGWIRLYGKNARLYYKNESGTVYGPL
jgi:hypothetical protein